MRLIKLKDGKIVTAEQFRSQNSNVQYGGKFPSIEYLETIGASQIDVPITSAAAAANVRTERDALLAKTDWVVIRAKELGQTVPVAIFEYRGDLRQVPEQAGFPHTIIWPTEIEG